MFSKMSTYSRALIRGIMLLNDSRHSVNTLFLFLILISIDYFEHKNMYYKKYILRTFHFKLKAKLKFISFRKFKENVYAL